MGIVLAIILFSLIVIVHELGHFLLAKANGIEVFEFSLGMGPTLVSKQIGDTLYCLKLLPLGGSCMMGEDEIGSEETSDEESQVEEQVDTIRKGNFNEKSVWARMAVIAGGPAFNFILAWVFATIMVMWIGYVTPEIGTVTEGSVAQEAGIESGDVIVSLNNRNVYIWSEISVFIQMNQGEELVITYERDGVRDSVTVTPTLDEETQAYRVGITASHYSEANLLSGMQYGVYTVRHWIFTAVDSLKLMLSGAVSLNEMSGAVGIVSVVDDTYEESATYGWDVVIYNLMSFTVLLSANLGVMNLLPIPALDGGRLVFLAYEAIRGKRIAPEKEGMAHFIGFMALMVLMAVIMFNDIMKLL